jgi:phospholipid-translocating ATPase
MSIRFTEQEYASWNRRYHDATVSLDDRDHEIDVVSEEIEQEFYLLGATAIEDKLQDGVPETIADFKRAGIKVWVATGDKLETAIGELDTIHISRFCDLLLVDQPLGTAPT